MAKKYLAKADYLVSIFIVNSVTFLEIHNFWKFSLIWIMYAIYIILYRVKDERRNNDR